MRQASASLLLVAAVGIALASAFSETTVRMQSRGALSADWVRMYPSRQDAVIPLKFAVKHKNIEQLYAELDAVSNPDSPRYGKHLSLEQIREITQDVDAIRTVRRFLAEFDLVDLRATINEEFITVAVTVATAEKMLSTRFFQYFHLDSNTVVNRADDYSLPADVAAAVDFVGHVVSLPRVRSPATISMLKPSTASGEATPSVISQFYGIKDNKVSNAKATKCVFETLGQSFSPSDVALYDKTYNVPDQSDVVVKGSNSPSSCTANPNNCVEAELDVQVISAIAQGSETTFWSIPNDESFLQWIDAVASDPTPPLVHSISYGEPEPDTDSAQDTRFDAEVAKMGARGLTVVVSSGDDGVAGAQARNDKSACGFSPSYPATAPSVTAVGATMGPETGSTEVACTSNNGGTITTGGGFSGVYKRPTYQAEAVSSYLTDPAAKLPPTSMFASSGRAYPDVALMGHNYPIAVAGQFYVGSGTSASAPLFGAMVTLANSARLDAGKSSLGFVNPALYKFADEVFNDITSGENNCCAAHSNPVCCQYGFTAIKGWDPVTGRGSINFPKFVAAALALP